VEIRVGDVVIGDVVANLDHGPTRRAVETERAFLAELGAGCALPVAAHLSPDGVLRAFMAKDGESVQVSGHVGDTDDHVIVGRAAADKCRRILDGQDVDE
jgi:hydroxymethylbilane synthase